MSSVTVFLTPADAAGLTADGQIEVITRETPSKDIRAESQIHRTTYQARLGRKLDNITRRMIDNHIRLTAHPTDMIRVSVKRDEISRDILSRQITNVEVLPIILPPLKNIPLRHLVRSGSDIQISSLYTISEQEYFEIYAPVQVRLEPEDLLIRIIYDTAAEEPYVMILQVKEQLATMSYSSITMLKYFVTFYDQELPQTVIKAVTEMNLKRDKIGY